MFRSCRRGLFRIARAFHLIAVLSVTSFCLGVCGPCSVNGLQKSTVYDSCASYSDNYDVGSQNIFFGDTSSDFGNPTTGRNPKGVCTRAHSLFFPSTIHGFPSQEHNLEAAIQGVSGSQSTQASRWASNSSWSSDYGMFELFNGRTISCSLNSREDINELSSLQNDSANQSDISCRGPLLNQKNTGFMPNKNPKMTKSSSFDDSSSPPVEISPPVLDWGNNFLYFPSIAFVTIANICNDSILHVYESFSTNSQFYPCNLSEVLLEPGEVASICFVFLPRLLGFSSTHLILQTSLGGFLLQAKGYAIESPYDIQPLVSLDVSSSGNWRNHLSLFNPSDEILYVEEIAAWISVSLENTSHYIEAICSLDTIQGAEDLDLLSYKDLLVVKSGKLGLPLLAVRPHKNWEIGPRYASNIIEMDFAVESEGKYIGVFCMKLLRSSQDQSDIVMVPLEAELVRKAAYDNNAVSVSVSLEAIVISDASETVVAISLKNDASSLLSVVKISEVTDTKLFPIKFFEGLLVFPGTVTQVALVTCAQLPTDIHCSPPIVSNMNKNCELLILTNDSSNPQIGVPCRDIFLLCSRNLKSSSVGYDPMSVKVESNNLRTGSLGNGLQLASEVKIMETDEAEELLLGNWKSLGTISGMSVLDDCEVVFPMVEVGTHHSKWITVTNPSQQPVVMQLILNIGETIDECRGPDGFIQPPSSGSLVRNESTAPTRYGFSMAKSALTEAYVHPYGRASLGPIFFHPSNRCVWISSALIRNNLSGVEWLSLRGFGGSLFLTLLEGSQPVQSLEFNLNLPVPQNIFPFDMLHLEDTFHACSQPLLKVLYANNTGDMPVEVKKIDVSGTECALDGFMIHACKGFTLEPGKSAKLLISYQTDFSAAMVHRDLQFVLATGILVIPMKVNLPLYMLNLCRKSMFWVRAKKISVAVFAASLTFLVFCFIFLQVMALGSQYYICKGEKSSIVASTTGKTPQVHRNLRNDKFFVPCKIDSLLKSAGEIGRYPEHQGGTAEQEIASQHAKPTQEGQSEFDRLADTQKEKALASSLLSKSVAVESSDMLEGSQPSNLTIRTVKEKGKRRRKRKGAGAGLTALIEISSSQSGNSTPSSPLSPLSSGMPKRTSQLSSDRDQSVLARNLFAQEADQNSEKNQVITPASKLNILEPEVCTKHCSNNWFCPSEQQLSLPRKTANKPALLPSATFPLAGRPVHSVLYSSPFLAQTSKVAPHARAPGSKLHNQKTMKTEDKEQHEDEFRYDIWGDHFSGLHATGMSKYFSAITSNATESNSNSFFIRDPLTLVDTSQPKSVSFHQAG